MIDADRMKTVIKIARKDGTELEVELEIVDLAREESGDDDNVGIIARVQRRKIGWVSTITGMDWHTEVDGISIDEDYRDTDLGVCMLKHLYENQGTFFTEAAARTVTVYGLEMVIPKPVPEYVGHILHEAALVGVFDKRITAFTGLTESQKSTRRHEVWKPQGGDLRKVRSRD